MKSVLYGVRGSNPSRVADSISSVINCEFRERESDYLGVYKIARLSGAEIRVLSQIDPEGGLHEEEFEEYGTLIYIDGDFDIPRLESLMAPVGHLVKLR